MARQTSPQVALLMAEAQLHAASVVMSRAHSAVARGEMTAVEAGRLLAKQTRLERKVQVFRYELSFGVPA